MMDDVFDSAALEVEAGIRAIWLLYQRGKWGYLADFGLERSEVEPLFERFDEEHMITRRLTRAQIAELIQTVPEVEAVGVELRLAYALKYYSRDTQGVVQTILSHRQPE